MTEQKIPDNEALLKFAHKLADQSSLAILRMFRQKIDIANKEAGTSFDPVTEADREAEKIMRSLVAKDWPEHDFYGEEFQNIDRNAEYQWCVDPIDGTRSFIMGYPTWGTLIGLKKSGVPYLGIMNQPFTNERYWSTERHALYSGPDGDRILQTRKCASIEDAMLATTDPGLFTDPEEKEKYARVADHTKLNRYGSDCYAYCMLASGTCDLIIESGLKPFDIMALIPIVERAGGCITTWSGGDPVDGGRILASGDPALHAKVLNVLNN